jgi:DNA-binding transcriptional ArsR family regulator
VGGEGTRRRTGTRADGYREPWAKAVAKALSHPVRLNVLRMLSASASSSPSDIATRTSESLPSLSYHVRELVTAGLLKSTGTQQVRGAVEHFYELTPEGNAVLEAVNAVLDLDPKRTNSSGRASRRRRG